jgi:hypothetical protein
MKTQLKETIKERYEKQAGAPLVKIDQDLLAMSTILIFENGEEIEVDDEQFMFMLDNERE